MIASTLARICRIPLPIAIALVPVCRFDTDTWGETRCQSSINSDHHLFLPNPLLEVFEEKIGIAKNFLFARTGLPERTDTEGVNSATSPILLTSNKRALYTLVAKKMKKYNLLPFFNNLFGLDRSHNLSNFARIHIAQFSDLWYCRC